MLWLYYLDLFRPVEGGGGDHTINELMELALIKAGELGISPGTVCRVRVGDDVIIEVRGKDGTALKLIKAKNPTGALRAFYENEDKAVCVNA